MPIKEFWNFNKPFLRNKGLSKNNDITLKNKKEIITDEKKLANLFNNTYINIVEISSGIKPETSIKQIKEKIIPDSNKNQEIFSFKPTTVENVKKLLNDTDTKNVVGIDTIPPKLIKMASNVLAPILTTSINSSTKKQCVPRKCKSSYCFSIR